jgi:hypothetical protein
MKQGEIDAQPAPSVTQEACSDLELLANHELQEELMVVDTENGHLLKSQEITCT